MKKQNENEELQSRREFFKEAAKKALPVIGTIALASSPIIAQAAQVEKNSCSMGCRNECIASCKGSCYGECKGTCKYECKGGCKRACTNTCKNNASYSK